MIKFAVYRLSDGYIVRRFNVPESSLLSQVKDGEEFFLNCPKKATHIINNEPVIIEPEPEAGEKLTAIRNQRNRLLRECDWTQLQDAPVNRGLWQAYRQQLRDFPAICDPANPVWPVPPTGVQ